MSIALKAYRWTPKEFILNDVYGQGIIRIMGLFFSVSYYEDVFHISIKLYKNLYEVSIFSRYKRKDLLSPKFEVYEEWFSVNARR